ncbi:MAG: indolepyruvate oxidoreductase subunit beta [Desulfobacterales bacterium]|jgi:indolepyruvate ferredoxin oxidoreductase beta subunit
MGTADLRCDPYNVIITGVGGQGNVMASRVMGNVLSEKGLQITIGETFGASQRGGSVMSHVRVSADSTWSPQIPKGKAHMVVSLEPIEALRVFLNYGNPHTNTLCNMRPIQPVAVISGDATYPSLDYLEQRIAELSKNVWFVKVTDDAVKLGNPIYGNIMMIGAIAETGALPIAREDFMTVISKTMPSDRVAANLAAFDRGIQMISRLRARMDDAMGN